MKVYLNAGFGEPLSAADLAQIRSLGFAGIRTDIYDNGLGPEIAAGLKATDLEAIFLVKIAQVPLAVSLIRAVDLQARVVIEIENEPDFTTVTPSVLSAAIRDAVRDYPDIRFVSGGVSHRGQDYLRQVIEVGIPENVAVGFHTYRNTPPDDPLPGYASRAAEFAQLHTLAGARSLWCTECGWHTGRFGGFRIFDFWIGAQRFSDAQVAEFTRRELELHKAAGVDVFVLYQYNDGPSGEAADRFGIRRTDGSLKPVAEVVRAFSPPAPVPVPVPTPTPIPTPPPAAPSVFWRECSDFRLAQRQMAGEDIVPIIRQRKVLGFDVLRVFGMKANNTGWELNPDGRPYDHYFATDLPRFFETLRAEGIRCEWVVFADTALLPGYDRPDKQRDFWQRTLAAVRPFMGSVVAGIELLNEFGHSTQRIDPSQFSAPDPIFYASHGSGLSDAPPVAPFWHRVTYHPRRLNGQDDARGATNCSPWAYQEEFNKPVPFYPNETARPDQYGFRHEYARLMGKHAATGWGGCFHSGEGVDSQLFPPNVEACARAFVEGLNR
jgi:hypothetical protein